ncbi:hypothetical protein Btru_057781 [Bulinus truncatus]|nr:hypothetical protein Btru_057781 [Bulinus truncatus]
MEPPCSFLFLLFLAFLLICSLQISARDIPTTETTFVQEPEANYYIRKDPVKIVCKVRNADDILFECNDIQIPPTSEENVDASPDYPDVSEARLTIKKDDIVNFEKTKPGEQFWCRCVALDVDSQVIAKSRKGMMSLASEASTYPDPEYEINDRDAVTLTCEAFLVERISVVCHRQRLSLDQLSHYERNKINKTVTARFVVTARNVTEPGYNCKCIGLYFGKDKKWHPFEGGPVIFTVKSQTVKPFIENNFQTEPTPQRVSLGDEVELSCSPPRGHPKPEITWYKGNRPIDIDQDSNYVIRKDGTLIIEMMREEDEGRYFCLAFNEAGRKRTKTANISLKDKFLSTTTASTITTTTTTTTTTLGAEPEPEIDEVFFVGDLIPQYNVTDDTPAVLTCHAVFATFIIFICNNKTVEASQLKTQTMFIDGIEMKINTLEVSKQQLMSNEESDTYECYCRALSKPHGSEKYADGLVATITYLGIEEEITEDNDTVIDATQKPVLSREPYISKELHSEYYIVKNKPVSLSCEARNVKSITFTCDGKEVPDVETQKVEETGVEGDLVMENIVTSTIEVSKPEDENDIVCQCIAYFFDERTRETKTLSSRDGVVKVASLKKMFIQDPQDKAVRLGEMFSLSCSPPVGSPPPVVYWTKDGEKLVFNELHFFTLLAEDKNTNKVSF